MTMSLYWIPDNIQGHDLSDELKYVLRKRGLPEIFTSGDISYLQGLKDANIQGAETLIAAIRKYDRVRVYEE